MDNPATQTNSETKVWYNPKNKTLIKALVKDYPSETDIQKFRKEFDVLKGKQLLGVRKVIDYQVVDHQHQIVMDYIEGTSLRKFLQINSLLLVHKVHLMIKITKILENIHGENIIHKNINPDTILINQSTEPFLTNFNLSSWFTLRQPNLGNPETIEGSLDYISPEQTGRMNRSIDYRTDLYALGATFYELLTERPVFKESDALALVHAHLAKIPENLSIINQSIPIQLSKIVLKLLEKNPENRYQSALGLRKDLEKYLRYDRKENVSINFELGQEDFSGKLQIPEKLYGREKEIKVLLEAFQRVKSGNVEFTLVAGYSGTGKSALVNETHKPLTSTKGYFVEGKFDQLQRNIPFSAWIQAFQNFIDLLLTENEHTLNYWREIILDAVGDNGAVLTDVIPNLELVIGKQSKVAELGGQEAQNRFNYVIQNFVKAITTKKHPLIIFIDDLQWADVASLQLLKTLVTDQENAFLLCVGAYRDNEVSSNHPLVKVLAEIEQERKNVNKIKVGNLSKEAIGHLLSETLNLPQEAPKLQQLSDILVSKTQGNAFFTHQFLKNLYEKELLKFKPEQKQWHWNDLAIIEANITDNVVEFMAKKVEGLPDTTQKLLELASCIGNVFQDTTLKIIAEKEIISEDLEIAISEGLIHPLKNYQYKFIHDRIQQAAYSLIPEKEKQVTHLKIGSLLYNSLDKEAHKEFIFDMVNHFNYAESLIRDKEERTAIAQLNLMASHKAKNAVAYEAGLRYCQAGKSFLSEEDWATQYTLQLELSLSMIELEHYNNNIIKAQKLCEDTLKQVKSVQDQIKVYELMILLKINQNHMTEAISFAREALVKLKIVLPEDSLQIQQEIERLRQEVAIPLHEIAQLSELSDLQDEEQLIIVRILTNASSAAYIADPTLYPLVILHTVRIFRQYGHTPLAASAYSWYGALLCGVYGEIDAGYEFGKLSLHLLKKFDASNFIAKVSNMFNVFIRPWREPLKNTHQSLPEAIQGGFENGDIEYAFYAAVHYCNYLFYGGHPLEKVTEQQTYYSQLIKEAKYDFHESFLTINQQVIANLRGEGKHPEKLHGAILNGDHSLSFWLENNILFLVICFYEAQTRLAYLFEDYGKAVNAAEEGFKYRQAAMGTLYHSEHNWYASLALLSGQELKPYQKKHIEDNQTQLKQWALSSPANFQHKYDLIQAELCRHQKDYWAAMDLYDQAIIGAAKNGLIQEQALANECAFRFYYHLGKDTIAQAYFSKAYQLYKNWGATAKLKQMEEKYTDLTLSISQLAQVKEDHSLSFDKTTLLQAIQSLSQQVHLRELIQTMLDLLIKNSGANKVTFLQKETNTWLVEADQENDVNFLTEPIPFEHYPNIPQQVINYALRNKEVILRDNISQDTTFRKDAYIQQRQSKSVLIVPVKKQAKLIALLYLENNLNTEVFHKKRVELVSAITTQLAISMENTLLYETLENKVALRTKELQESNEELQVMNEELRQTQEELHAQRDYVAEKNKVLQEFNTKINGSLKVAQTIQEAVLPYQTKLERLLENYFIINQPKDVVSGDFYWLNEINGKVILVVADCTGHGIPGAFMTLIGANLLDKIIRIRQVTQPNDILNQLHEEVQAVLKQHYTTNNKGMDASVISLEKTHTHTNIRFSGAKNNFYYYSDGLYELKGDRKSIGGIQDESIRFTNQQLTLPAGGMLYLGSDGLEDQNNSTRKKFGRKRLQVLLSDIATLPVGDQKTKIKEALEHYMQDAEQRDDILWMGIRV